MHFEIWLSWGNEMCQSVIYAAKWLFCYKNNQSNSYSASALLKLGCSEIKWPKAVLGVGGELHCIFFYADTNYTSISQFHCITTCSVNSFELWVIYTGSTVPFFFFYKVLRCILVSFCCSVLEVLCTLVCTVLHGFSWWKMTVHVTHVHYS